MNKTFTKATFIWKFWVFVS